MTSATIYLALLVVVGIFVALSRPKVRWISLTVLVLYGGFLILNLGRIWPDDLSVSLLGRPAPPMELLVLGIGFLAVAAGMARDGLRKTRVAGALLLGTGLLGTAFLLLFKAPEQVTFLVWLGGVVSAIVALFVDDRKAKFQ